ncbi:MAG: hypothetical protein QOH26_369, partial [Actinomycetota bacterium]|nr:hypothetical protein [Actinomycetota bacterium]
MRWIPFPLGLFIVLGTAGSVIRTLILPRGLTSHLAAVLERRIVGSIFLFTADRFESYETKDKILALSGPMSLLVLLVGWIALFLFGFALMLWPAEHSTFGQALREAGSSLFTLGFTGSDGVLSTTIAFVAAATGLVVVALQIAYLPTLYSQFNRREALVTLLQSRAGAPAWGPEILIRAYTVGLMDSLAPMYSEWERWAAEVAESHTNYPVLAWFRSPHPLRSWVLSLLAVMDSAALYSSVSPSDAPIEARLAIRMGFTCLRNVAEVLRVPYDPDPFPDDPIELTFEEFHGGVHRLESVGFPMERTPEEAWTHFKGWRI